MNAAAREKTAVVLSGGVSYGAYEAGVLKALMEGRSMSTSNDGLNAGIFVGTSVGAFNAAVMASHAHFGQGHAAAALEAIWRDRIAVRPERTSGGMIRLRGNPLPLFDPLAWTSNPLDTARTWFTEARTLMASSYQRGTALLESNAPLTHRLLDGFNVSSLFSVAPFSRLLATSIPLAELRGGEFQIRITALNWLTGQVHVFGNNDMTDQWGHQIILASSAVPGVFQSVQINGTPYADGGIVMNTPMRPAIEAGADVLHVVSVNPAIAAMALPSLPSTISSMYRALAISLAASIDRDIEIARRVNEGITILESRGTTGLHEEDRALTLAVGGLAARPGPRVSYRKLTIHRYQLQTAVDNFFKWFDFSDSHIAALMEQGYHDASIHDCTAARCILQ